MLYAISLWTFHEKGTTLPGLVASFADLGFTAMSLSPPPVFAVDPGEAREAGAEMRQRQLPLTLHAGFKHTDQEWDFLFDCFADRFSRITFDAAMVADARGRFYDAKKMAARLADVARRTEGTAVRFGVEDFPLDAEALRYYADDLAPVRSHPRFGMLVDLGHLNLRIRRSGHWQGQTPAAYLQALPLPVIEVHVHDNDGTRDLHQPIGDGNADLSAMAEALRDLGFDGVSTIEIAPGFHGSNGPTDTPKAVASRDTWQQWIEYIP